MRHKALIAGTATGIAVGLLARHWWKNRLASGPPTALAGALADGVDGVADALYQATSLSLVPGNQVTWCNDGKIFDALDEEVRRAQRSIHVDIYIFKPGRAAERLARALAARARAGVAVRVLVDPIGSAGFEDGLCQLLQEGGCEVQYFRPVRRVPLKFWGRNHRKLVVIDGKVAFTGGFGVGDEWLGGGDEKQGPAWREANVCVRGPVVRQMQQAFAAHWMETGGKLLPVEELAWPEEVGDARACFVTSMDVKGLSNARWVTHIAMAAARKRLWIANAYFVPPTEIITTLCGRREQGVDVRLLLPGSHMDHAWVSVLQRSTYRKLRDCDVRIYEYQPSMIHAKTMLVDDRMVVVGSTNLDPLSQEVLEEGSLVVDDRQLAGELEARWLRDLQASKEIPAGALPGLWAARHSQRA